VGGRISNTYFYASAMLFPVGSVIAWLKSFPGVATLPDVWRECNGQVLSLPGSPLDGQTLPDLNGTATDKRFLRGSATSGSTGGAETITLTGVNGGDAGTDNHVRGVTKDILNPYYEVVWIIRVM